MKKRTLALLGLVAALAISLAGCTDKAPQDTETPDPTGSTPVAESDIAYIQSKGTVVVGVTDYPPLDYQDESGEWVGFDADMCRAVAEALGVECEFVSINWNNKLMELEGKSIDVIWNGMTLTDEVANGSSPTIGYLSNGQVLVLKAENAAKFEAGELALADFTPAVEAGSSGEKAAAAAGLSCVPVEAQVDALMEVAAGTSDSCVIDTLLANVSTGEGTDYADLVIAADLEVEMDVAACRKGSDLTEFINEQMVTLYENGTTLQLAEQYGIADMVVKPE